MATVDTAVFTITITIITGIILIFMWFQAKQVMKGLYQLFVKTDATLVEINPLAETHDGSGDICGDGDGDGDGHY